MATGSILGLSRAIGETAPLIMIGALTYVRFDPTPLGAFTALPIQIYNWTRQPQEEFQGLAAAAIIVLLGHAADPERRRDLHPQPLSEAMVSVSQRTQTATRLTRPDASTAIPAIEVRARRGRGETDRRRDRLRRQATSACATTACPALTRRHAGHRGAARDRLHRAVGLRQEHADPLLQPPQRPDPGRAGGGRDPLPRRGPLRRGGRPGRGAAPHRHGLPEAEPVPEVDLRQHRLRPARARHEGATSTSASSRRCGRRRSGTRSRTA